MVFNLLIRLWFCSVNLFSVVLTDKHHYAERCGKKRWRRGDGEIELWEQVTPSLGSSDENFFSQLMHNAVFLSTIEHF